MTHLLLSSKYALVKRLIALAIIIAGLASLPAKAQENSVTIGSTQLKEDAVLWLVPSGNSGQQGLILPVTTKAGFTPSEKGMVIYDHSDDKVYYWNGTDWQDLVGSGSTSLNSISDLPDVDVSGVATGQVLKWNGSTWVPGSDEAGGGGVGSDDQQLTFDEGTKILSIENGNGVDLGALLSGGAADNWGTQVVEKDNSLEGDGTTGSPIGLASQGATDGQVLKWNGSGWVPANDDGGAAGATYSAGDGITIDGANVISNTGDADADPVNELQSLSFNSGTNELSLSDGNTVTIPSGGVDADSDPTNELQDISLSGTNLSISDGSTIDLSPIVPPGGTDDQNLVLIGDILTIEDGTGSVDLATYIDDADADPTNEIDVTSQNGLLLGDGAAVTGLAGTADGQVAKWDAGTSSWIAGIDETGSGGSSLWTENGADIHYDAGRVGIGINTPEGQMEISHNSTVPDPQLMLFENDTDYARLTFKNNTGNFWTIAGLNNTTRAGERLNFYNGSTGDLMSLTGDGKLGIGVGIFPKSTLDIKGNFWDVTNTEGDFRIGDDTYRLKVGVAIGGAGAGDARIRAVGGTNRIMIGGGANDVLTVNDQNVGVGTITPISKLDVEGNIRSSDLTGTGDRNVMADANGNLIIGSGGGSSVWTENGTDIHYNTGKVGIGTTTPASSLSIETDGSNWDLSATEGDFRIGDASHRLKMSSSTGGAGAGNSRIRSQGGSNRLLLGSGTNDVMSIIDQKVGIGTYDPLSQLSLQTDGTKWDLTSTEGDFRIGDDTYRLKVGVAIGGAGAGDARIRAVGGTNRIMIGGGANDVLTIDDRFVGVGTITPASELDVMGTIRSSDLTGTGERNVVADATGNLIIGAEGGSSLWTQNGSNIHYNVGNVGIGNSNPGTEPGAGKYLTVATGTSPSDNSFASIEIQGGQGSTNKPVGRVDFISNSAPGNSAITRIESRTAGGAQFKGDLAFHTKDGSGFAGSSLQERLTIKYNGNVGIGTITPSTKLDVQGNINTSSEINRSATGTANLVPIAYGTIHSAGAVDSGSSNFTVAKLGTGWYAITINGESYHQQLYTTSVTRNTQTPGFIGMGSGGNRLYVYTNSASGIDEDAHFTFVVYKR